MLLKIILLVLHFILAIGIIVAVLMQSGRSAGLSGAIAGGAETFFGKKKGLDELLGKITVYLGVAFAVVSLTLFVLMKP